MSKAKSPFTKETYAFIKDLKANNNRDWFKSNKSRYEDVVKEPFMEFIASMQAPMAKISKHINVDPSPNSGSMFRIYRDTRFSADKTPYKTHMACQFRHEAGKDAHAPGYYFHISLEQNIIGGGIWHPEAKPLQKIRERIAAKPEEWQKVITNRKFKEVCGDVEGDTLKRPPRGFDPDHKYIDYIKMKDFWGGTAVDQNTIMSDKFQSEVIETFSAISPLMKFLCASLGLPW